MDLPDLMIIVATTRPGGVGPAIAEWFDERVLTHGRFTPRTVNLAELALPFMDEPNHPRLGRYTQQHTRDWSDQVAASDAFVFVMPEYNHGFNAPLKNAIDFLHQEWARKPVGFVSYGGVAGGTRAVQMIKPVVSCLQMVPVTDAVAVPFVQNCLDEHGRMKPSEIHDGAATTLLDGLARWTAALRQP